VPRAYTEENSETWDKDWANLTRLKE